MAFRVPRERKKRTPLEIALAKAKRDANIAKETARKNSLVHQLKLRGVTESVVFEHRFHPVRKWRFDVAIPSLKIAFEIESVGGRHTTFDGYELDCEKYNEAILMGWMLLRGTHRMINKGVAADVIVRAIARCAERR